MSDPSRSAFRAANQAVIGDPEGKITLIEFFDYNCGSAKRLERSCAAHEGQPNIFASSCAIFPILSPGSVEAAKIANAFLRQFQGEKFREFHQNFSVRTARRQDEALAVAKDLGGDMDKLAKDADSASITAGIEESEKFAKSLQVSGTPTYVIGEDVAVGAVGYDELEAKIANIKKCGKAICS